MGGLTSKLVQTAVKVAITRNEYGDTVYGTQSSVPCLYRDISIIEQSANREQINLDGILWLDDDAVVAKGDIYAVDGVYLRIERITAARRRLTDNAIDFYKCGVTKQRQVS